MQLLTIVAAIGAFQGIIILISILLKYRHKKNIPLVLLLIVFSLRLATIPTWREDILFSYPWIYPLTAPLPFLFGPLLWWYIRELVSNRRNVPKPLYIHFLPYIFEMIALVYSILARNGEEYAIFLHNVFSGNPPVWLPLRNSLKVLLNIAYIVFSWRLAFVKKPNQLSVVKRLWIISLIIVPSVVLAAFAYVAIFPSATGNLSRGFTASFCILSVTMALLIYVVYFLLLIAPVVSLPALIKGEERTDQLCSGVECRDILAKVEKKFDEGVFQNPDLNLFDLAAEIGIHPNRLSYAINRSCNESFRTQLNERRLNYFTESVKNGALRKQSMLDLAFEAGFPSKSTFNRVFKEKTGMSPSEYVKQSDTA